MLAGDPEWLPHRLLDQGATIRFVRADRKMHRNATFLNDEYLGQEAPRADVALATLADVDTRASAPLHFIFHSAFCCSTLLARSFDLPGLAMGLKEPIILNDAVQLVRAGRLRDTTLDLVLRLLERPMETNETIVIKPSNAANRLMTDMLRLRPNARAILMYRPLPAFLRSVARKGMFGRIWARRLLAEIRGEMPFVTGFSELDYQLQTDLQAAAMGWLIQHGQFAHIAAAMPGRIRILSSVDLLEDKQAAITTAMNWFMLEPDPDLARSIVGGSVFADDAKKLGQRFDLSAGPSPTVVDEGEIEMVSNWIAAVAAHVGLNLNLSPALFDR